MRQEAGTTNVSPAAPGSNPATYADKTKAHAKQRELAPNMLYVYATRDRKVPLGYSDWAVIDECLVGGIIQQAGAQKLIWIQGSGFDARFDCGYVA